MSISDFVLWLASGLGASFVFSYFAERSVKFNALSFETKKLVSTIGASVIAVLAYVTVTYVPAYVWVSLSPYWQIVIGVIAVNYGTQGFHQYDKNLPQ